MSVTFRESPTSRALTRKNPAERSRTSQILKLRSLMRCPRRRQPRQFHLNARRELLGLAWINEPKQSLIDMQALCDTPAPLALRVMSSDTDSILSVKRRAP